MKPKNINEAKDPDLRASAAALRRAAEMARKTAIQTDTNLVIVKNGKLTRIPAQTLRAAFETGKKKSA
jgi:hypothetical protein